MEKSLRIPIVSASFYIAFQLFANILSSKIAVLPWLNLSVDGGTIIYPLTFTLRDFVHKTWGKQNARFIVILAALLNILMVALFWIVGQFTPDPTWPYQDAYNAILLPVWRIVVGSVVAQVVSELVDTEIFSIAYKKFGGVIAVLFSNAISIAVDSAVFCAIAFLGDLPFETVWQIFLANILIKYVITIITVPSIKLIPETAAKNEI